jgi:hypothetical protein
MILVLSLSSLSSFGLDSFPTTENSEFHRLERSRFYEMINGEAEAILKKLSYRLTKKELRSLQKVRGVVIEILKKNNPFLHIKEILIKHGLGAGLTAALTEVTTILILPSIFTAAGLPALAVFSAASPSFAVTVPAYIAWSTNRAKKKLGKSLGITNIKALDKLRKELLRFSIETKIHSALIREVGGLEEISILKRKFARFRSRPVGHSIDLFELETIFKKHIGRSSFSIIKEHNENPKLYACLLANHIRNNPEADKAFLKLARERLKNTPKPLNFHQESELFTVHEKLQFIDQLKEGIHKSQKNYKSGLDSGLIPNRPFKVVKEFYQNIQNDLSAIEYDIKRFEYGFLNQISLGEDVEHIAFKHSPELFNKRLQLLEKNLKAMHFDKNSPEFASRIGHKLKLLVQKMSKRNHRWLPSKLALASHKSCFGLMQSILATP